MGAESAALSSFSPIRTDRGVTIAARDGAIAIDLVEHLLAAFGGLGVRDGVRVEFAEPEPPLLDGGARCFADALLAIDAPRGAHPALRIARAGTLEYGMARYRFEPGDGVALRVAVEFRAPVGHEEAEWLGDADDFIERIAPARTFGWADEHAMLLASGRSRGLDLGSVIVFNQTGVIDGCRDEEHDEVARHKLLDLIGDLALHGGPPSGTIEAFAPGHTATHRIIADALREGIVERSVRGGGAGQ